MRIRKNIYVSLLAFLFLTSLSVNSSLAIPTQFGESGLLNQPTAETLNAGNICLGLWVTQEKDQDDVYTLTPVTITLGLGAFLETYGSFPNVLLNGEETWSRRGYANVGFKLRFLGERSSSFKMALDAHVRRKISDIPEFDGLADTVYRLIASYKKGPFGIHANVGRINTESPENSNVKYENQNIYGAGIEFYPTARLRLIAEVSSQSEKISSTDDVMEVNFGIQYYVTPHLTLNIGAGVGMTDLTPDWTALVGLSGCQGIGTYLTPVPQLIKKEDKPKEEKKPVKAIKIKALTPLTPKLKKRELSAVSKLEVPVDPDAQEVLVKPSEKLVMLGAKKPAAIAVSPVAEFVRTPPKPSGAKVIAEPIVAVVHRKFRLPEFTFQSNQSELSPEGQEAITSIIEEVRKENAWFLIRAEGHTDTIGSETYNNNLSLKRAVSAATHLVQNTGFDPENVFVRGMGESSPIADNSTDEGRSQNRRVEILILLPK